MVTVAQLVRAPGCDPGGRGFESPQSPFFPVPTFLNSPDHIRKTQVHIHRLIDLSEQIGFARTRSAALLQRAVPLEWGYYKLVVRSTPRVAGQNQ